MYPCGGVRTVNVANPTNGYAAEKGISKVVSDGEWKPSEIYTMIKFTAEYKDKTYTFDFGYEAYIFHIALCNEFVDKFNEAELLNFISLVSQCYLKDDNATPLGALADYIADHWIEVKDLPRRKILELFYTEN